jgi:hypothetical protein
LHVYYDGKKLSKVDAPGKATGRQRMQVACHTKTGKNTVPQPSYSIPTSKPALYMLAIPAAQV